MHLPRGASFVPLGPAWHSETSKAYIDQAGLLCFYRCLWVILARCALVVGEDCLTVTLHRRAGPEDTLWGHQIFDLISKGPGVL